MALIYWGGFDHYGTRANMLLSGWVFNGGATNPGPSLTNPRTGSYCLALQSTTGAQTGSSMSYVWGGTQTTVGCGFALYVASFPTSDCAILWFRDSSSNPQICVTLGPAGVLKILRATGPVVATSSINLVAGSYSHIELGAFIDDVNGWAELRINEVMGAMFLGDTRGSAGVGVGRVDLGKRGTSPAMVAMDIDDIYIWDNTGGVNDDFQGDCRAYTSFPISDEPGNQWTASTGTSGFACIDEVPPSSADYVEASVIGDVSEFQKTSIGILSNDIRGIAVVAFAAKTDAGASTFRLGMHSGAFVENSAPVSPGTAYSFYTQKFELDPNGDVLWTREAADAATVRITRES